MFPPGLKSFSLEGRTVLVAGASRGIGHALCLGLASTGAKVFGFGRTPYQSPHFHYMEFDLSRLEAIPGFFAGIWEIAGKIDVYIHASGITVPTQGAPQSLADFSSTMTVNLFGPFQSSMWMAQKMGESGGGSIIHVTSIGGSFGFPNNPGYVSSKGGLRMLTKALALDFGKKNVRVNNLAPGYIQTDMTRGSYDDPVRREERASRTMLNRWGTPEDLVGAAVFLASDASKYVTGIDLFVDGGWSSKGL